MHMMGRIGFMGLGIALVGLSRWRASFCGGEAD